MLPHHYDEYIHMTTSFSDVTCHLNWR